MPDENCAQMQPPNDLDCEDLDTYRDKKGSRPTILYEEEND